MVKVSFLSYRHKSLGILIPIYIEANYDLKTKKYIANQYITVDNVKNGIINKIDSIFELRHKI